MKKSNTQKSVRLITTLVSALVMSCNTGYTQGWTTVGSAGFSAGAVRLYISIATAPDGTPYVVYVDDANGGKATVMKDSSNVWVNVGNPGFSAGVVSMTTIAVDDNGIPYVAFIDSFYSNNGIVMKYVGGSWVTVGSGPFTDSGLYSPAIAIGQNDTPYIVCIDNGYGQGDAVVRKFDGSNWIIVGGSPCSTGSVDWTAMAIGSDGTPYVTYPDDNYNSKATVVKYSNGMWTSVGSAGFSDNIAEVPSIAVGTNDTLYVVYGDYYYSGAITVMKCPASGVGGWELAGSPGFSVAPADGYNNWIATDECGTPYIAFTNNNNLEVMLMKYIDGNWVMVGGSIGYSTDIAVGNTALAIDGNGMPYVAYIDTTEGDRATVVTTTTGICNTGVPAMPTVVKNWQVYPNPATTELTVSCEQGIGEVVICNVLGQTVASPRPSPGEREVLRVDISELPPGVYFVQMNGQAKKFVKE